MKLSYTHILFAVLFLFSSFVFAQEEVGIVIQNGRQAAIQDGQVDPQDLGVGDPRILPGNPLYFFKNMMRGIRLFVTFQPEAKAELQLQFTNEKIVETKKLTEQGDLQRAQRHLEDYERDVERLGELTEKFKERNREQAEKFAEKAIRHHLKHQFVIGELEKEVPPELLAPIKEHREHVLDHVGKIVGTIQDPERVRTTIDAIAEERGTSFKPLRNLEVLKAIEERIPSEARDAIRQAQENAIKRFKSDFEKLSEEQKKLLEDYIKEAGGDELFYLKAFDHMKFGEFKEKDFEILAATKERLLTKFEERGRELSEKNPEAAKKLFLPLELGTVENIRIMKDLEGNIDPLLGVRLMETKTKAVEHMRDQFSTFTDPAQKEEFIRSHAVRFPDVKQVQIFDEFKEFLTPEEQNLAEELKTKVMVRMKAKMEEARQEEERRIRARVFIGDDPEYIEIIEEKLRIIDPATRELLLRTQAEHLEKKMRYIEDAERLKLYEARIREKEAARLTLEQIRPQFFKELEEQERHIEKEINEERARKQVEEAAEHFQELSKKAENAFNDLPEDLREQFTRKAKLTLENAHKHLVRAKEALANQKFGEAYGQATSTLNVLRSLEELIEHRAKLRLKLLQEKPIPAPATAPSFEKEGVFCTQEYTPVCGVDGRTYSNRCAAEVQHGVKVAYEGECKKEVPLPGTILKESIKEILPIAPPLSLVPSAPSHVEVSIKEFAFHPATIRVAPSGAIVFTNFDSAIHNVQGVNIFVSDMAKNAQGKLSAPEKPGTYSFICGYHPYMKGQIIVE